MVENKITIIPYNKLWWVIIKYAFNGQTSKLKAIINNQSYNNMFNNQQSKTLTLKKTIPHKIMLRTELYELWTTPFSYNMKLWINVKKVDHQIYSPTCASNLSSGWASSASTCTVQSAFTVTAPLDTETMWQACFTIVLYTVYVWYCFYCYNILCLLESIK